MKFDREAKKGNKKTLNYREDLKGKHLNKQTNTTKNIIFLTETFNKKKKVTKSTS